MTETSAKRIALSLKASIIAVIALILALTATTFLTVYTSLSSEESIFHSGEVRLNLNNGKPVISDGESLLAPGVSIEKQFTVENLSTCSVWYKFYFSGVDSELANDVNVEIRDGETVLESGKMSDLNEKNTVAVATSLAVGEKKTLTIVFRLDENTGNYAEGLQLRFDFSAKAVQTRNNPDKKFR